MKKPKEVHDKLEALEARMRHLESERQEHLKFLNGIVSASPGKWEMSRDDFEAEFVIWAKNVANNQIKTALRDAGVE